MSQVFQAGYGARLKTAREAKSMSLADVASKLKLSARQVEAIEAEDLGHLPDEVFVRGFVRNYARLLRLPPDSLLAQIESQVVASEVITAPSAGLEVDSNNLRRWLVYPLLILVVFMVLVAGLYHWLRQGEDTLLTTPPEASIPGVSLSDELATPAPEGSAPLVDSANATITPLVLPGLETTPPVAVIPPTPAIPATPPAVAPVMVKPAPVPAPTQPPSSSLPAAPLSTPSAAVSPRSAPPVSVAQKPAAPVAAPISANTEMNKVKTGPRSMRFEPSQDAWIQVVDAQGNRFSKLVHAGAVESFAGEPPFRLVVGEAAQVKLTYNGHRVDLQPFIGQKVARLTLE